MARSSHSGDLPPGLCAGGAHEVGCAGGRLPRFEPRGPRGHRRLDRVGLAQPRAAADPARADGLAGRRHGVHGRGRRVGLPGGRRQRRRHLHRGADDGRRRARPGGGCDGRPLLTSGHPARRRRGACRPGRCRRRVPGHRRRPGRLRPRHGRRRAQRAVPRRPAGLDARTVHDSGRAHRRQRGQQHAGEPGPVPGSGAGRAAAHRHRHRGGLLAQRGDLRRLDAAGPGGQRPAGVDGRDARAGGQRASIRGAGGRVPRPGRRR